MASNLACIGLAVSDRAGLGQLGWRSGELLDLIPTYAATCGGLLSDCHLINKAIA